MGAGSIPAPTFSSTTSYLTTRSAVSCFELLTVTSRLAAEWVEDVRLKVGFTLEVEHVQQRSRELIKRTLARRRAGRMIEIIDAAELK